MWKTKVASKTFNHSRKKNKNSESTSPIKKIRTNKLALLFELQQKRWDEKFEPLCNESSINSCFNQSPSFAEEFYYTNQTDNLTKHENDNLNKNFKEYFNEFDNNNITIKFFAEESDPVINDFILNSKINDNPELLDKKQTNQTDESSNLDVKIYENMLIDLNNSASNNGNNTFIEKDYTGPYYFHNFVKLLNSVIQDNFYSYLFTREDRDKINVFFNDLSNFDQRLYIRLFLRRHVWLRKDKIQYHEFEDINQLLINLVNYQLVDDVNQLVNLKEALLCLKVSDVKQLCKNLHDINASTKYDYISAIVQHSKNISKFFLSSTSNFEASLLKKAKLLIGQCYRLNPIYKELFMRILTLASLQYSISDDDFSGQQLIFQMSLSTVSQNRYPDYVILKERRIFENKESLIQYNTALDLESRMWTLISKKQLYEAVDITDNVKALYMDLCDNDNIRRFVSYLPDFLRPYTVGGIYTRILNRGIGALESLKKFETAVDILAILLNQDLYHLNYRGRWYDRLSLNLDFHLRRPAESLSFIEKALNDGYVKAGHRFNILLRAKKICSSNFAKKNNLSLVWDKFKDDYMNNVQVAPLTYVNGLQIPHLMKGTSHTWLSMNDESSSIILRVEQLVLEHYNKLGYSEGLHAEGMTFLTLYMLLMWDIVFKSVPDVFINSFQDMPLDFRTNSFYIQRKDEIDSRLDYLSSCSNDDLCTEVALIWENQCNVKCSVISMDLFRDLNHVQGLVRCMGPMILASIFKRMSIDNRHVYGGVPDLVVWNPDTLIFKIIEVKGPNDKLSAKQILWLDYLLTLNVDAEVCHVKAIKRKRID